MTQAATPPLKWAIHIPTEKLSAFGRPCFDAACRGNNRIGRVLNYFVYEASREVERCKIDLSTIEGKVVILQRTHDAILKALGHMSEKTLITYLKKLTTWGYVLSVPYQKVYTVCLGAIEQAIQTPPEAEKRTRPHGATRKKGCNITTFQPDEMSEACQGDLQQKVVMLQKKVEQLQKKIDTLQPLFDLLQPFNVREASPQDILRAILGPLDSLGSEAYERESTITHKSPGDEDTETPSLSCMEQENDSESLWLSEKAQEIDSLLREVCSQTCSLPVADVFGEQDEDEYEEQSVLHAPEQENSPDGSKERVPEPTAVATSTQQSSIPIATGTKKPSMRQAGQSPTHQRGGASSSAHGRSNVVPIVTEEELTLRTQLQAKIDEWRGYKIHGNAPEKEVKAEDDGVRALAHKLYLWEIQHNPEGYSWKEIADLRKEIALNDSYWSKPENKLRIGGYALFQMSAQVILGKFRSKQRQPQSSGTAATVDTSVKLGGYSYVQDDGADVVYMPRTRRRAN